MLIRLNTTAPAWKSTALKFGWVKKMFYLYSVSPEDPRSRIPNIWLDLPCVVRRGLGKELQLRRRVSESSCCAFPFVVLLSQHTHIPSLPRVHVGIPFPRVTWPHRCTVNVLYSEARFWFRASDWPSALEARPKRSSLIGFRSINSDCHV